MTSDHTPSLLADASEREPLLADAHPLFRQVDAAFHNYLAVIAENPAWEDDRIEQELVHRGVEAGLAEDCVMFGPIAWGRELVTDLGLKCSPMFRLRSLIDGSEADLALATEMVYAWARAMVGLYLQPGRDGLFASVMSRSSEVNCINQALSGGASKESLRGAELRPSIIFLNRPSSPRAEPDA